MNIDDIRKEYGEDIYAYRQEFAGARMEKDGYSDEYVHFLEQKLTSDNSEYKQCGHNGKWIVLKSNTNELFCVKCNRVVG